MFSGRACSCSPNRRRLGREKDVVFCLVALIAFAGTALFAQDVTGTWQGTLPIRQAAAMGCEPCSRSPKPMTESYPRPFTASIRAHRAFQSRPSAWMEPPRPSMPRSSGFDLKYEGKLSADGNIHHRKLQTQGDNHLPLNFTRATPATHSGRFPSLHRRFPPWPPTPRPSLKSPPSNPAIPIRRAAVSACAAVNFRRSTPRSAA